MSITIGKWQNKAHNMAILSTPSSMVIADLNFFKWVNSRHSISGRRKNKFPTLVFLLTKCFSILQSFPPNKNFFYSINMLPHISIRSIEDGVKKCPSRSCSFFVHPDFHLPEYKSHPDFEIAPPLSKPLHDDHKAHTSRKGMSWIGHEPTDLRPAPFHRSRYPSSDTHFNGRRSEMISGKTPVIGLWQIPSAIALTFPKPFHDDHKAHTSGTGMSWIGHEPTDLISAPFHRSRYPSSDTHFNGRRSEMTSGKTPVIGLWQIPSAIAMTLSKPLHDAHKAHISGTGMSWIGHEPVDEKRTSPHPVSDSSIPILHYHNPSEVALGDIKKSVAGIEKKVAERESFIEKSGSENLSINYKESDIRNKADINMSHLTDQIYQMLERKIVIERERRGLYG